MKPCRYNHAAERLQSGYEFLQREKFLCVPLSIAQNSPHIMLLLQQILETTGRADFAFE